MTAEYPLPVTPALGESGSPRAPDLTQAPDAHPALPAPAWARVVLFLVLLLGAGLRLVHIDAPPLGVHAWRQSDTAGVARNFAREGLNITRPRVDWRGAGTGEVEMEFPLFCWLAGAGMRVAGEHEWVARSISLACSCATVLLAAALARRLAGWRVGLWTAAVLAVLPLFTFYGRAIQPEAMLTMGLMLGMLGMARWSGIGGPTRAPRIWLLVSWLGFTLACLLKLPVLYAGLPLGALAVQGRGWRAARSPALWVYAITLLASVGAWYVHARSLGAHTGLTFGILGSDKWWSAAAFDPATWNAVLFQSLAEKHLTWAGFILAIIGFCAATGARRGTFLLAWLGSLVVFVALVPVGNRVHEYYQVPFVPALALAAAIGCEHLRSAKASNLRTRLDRTTLGVLLIALAALSGFRLAQYWSRERTKESPHAHAAAALHTLSQPGDLVIVADGLGPTPLALYLADRKGWAMEIAWLRPDAIRARQDQGARWLLVTQPRTEAQRRLAAGAAALGEVVWSQGEDRIVRLRAAP